MSISPLFAWYDFWIGAFWDRKARKLYLLPIPCVGVVIQFARREGTREVLRERVGMAEKALNENMQMYIARAQREQSLLQQIATLTQERDSAIAELLAKDLLP